MIPMLLEILMKIVGFAFAKAEEKQLAEKELMKVFASLDKINDRATSMRNNYANARARMGHKNT